MQEIWAVFFKIYSLQAIHLFCNFKIYCFLRITNSKKSLFPANEIKIIAQSQGCFIPAFCNLDRVVKVIGISPFLITDREFTKEMQQEREVKITLMGSQEESIQMV